MSVRVFIVTAVIGHQLRSVNSPNGCEVHHVITISIPALNIAQPLVFCGVFFRKGFMKTMGRICETVSVGVGLQSVNYEYEISAPIIELQASQNEEIAKYQRLESQRLGADIGWRRAADEWFEKHFADWARAQRRVIDETLSLTDESLEMTSRHGIRELQPG